MKMRFQEMHDNGMNRNLFPIFLPISPNTLSELHYERESKNRIYKTLMHGKCEEFFIIFLFLGGNFIDFCSVV